MSSKGRVGVRELRQNLSAYLRRVASGETLEVTDRSRSVALLVPLQANATPLQRLVSSGRASAPSGDLLTLPPPRKRRGGKRLSEELSKLREDRL